MPARPRSRTTTRPTPSALRRPSPATDRPRPDDHEIRAIRHRLLRAPLRRRIGGVLARRARAGLDADRDDPEPREPVERRAAADGVGRDLEPGRLGQRDRVPVERPPSRRSPRQPSPSASSMSAAVERVAVEPARPGRGEVRDPLERGHARTTTRPRSTARARAPAASTSTTARPEDLLELDVEERPPPDRRQDVGQRRHARAPRGRPRSARRPAPVARGRARASRRGMMTGTPSDDARTSNSRPSQAGIASAASERGDAVLRAPRASRRGGPAGACDRGTPLPLPDLELGGDAQVVARVDRRVLGIGPVEDEPRRRRPAPRRAPRCSRGTRARRRCPSPAPAAPTARSPRAPRRWPPRTRTGSRRRAGGPGSARPDRR